MNSLTKLKVPALALLLGMIAQGCTLAPLTADKNITLKDARDTAIVILGQRSHFVLQSGAGGFTTVWRLFDQELGYFPDTEPPQLGWASDLPPENRTI